MRILVAAITILSVFGVGFLVGRMSIAQATTVSGNSVGRGHARPENEVAPQSVSGTVTATTRFRQPAEQPPYAALRAAALLATKQLQHGVRVQPFIFDRLNPDFVTLYELSPMEIARLESALQQTKAKIAALDATNAQIARNPNGTVRITIEPYPQQGGALLDSLRSEVLATLGLERSELFLALSDFDGSDSTEFGGFGLRRSIIEVGAVGPTGKGSSSFSTSTDSETKLQTMTAQVDAVILKSTHPALYARLVQAGLVP